MMMMMLLIRVGTVANPQTKLFCETLGIKNYYFVSQEQGKEEQKNENPEEIKLDDDLFC
jgi:hypothetical protein